MGQITDLHVMILIVQGGSIPDLYDLARVTAWGLHNLHDITRVSWAGFVPVSYTHLTLPTILLV